MADKTSKPTFQAAALAITAPSSGPDLGKYVGLFEKYRAEAQDHWPKQKWGIDDKTSPQIVWHSLWALASDVTMKAHGSANDRLVNGLPKDIVNAANELGKQIGNSPLVVDYTATNRENIVHMTSPAPAAPGMNK